jgi:hypothetical protein
MKSLTPEQFRDALQKGLGRALLHVREHGTAGLEEIILDGCLHNYSTEPIFEGMRTEWLMEMIDRSPNKAFLQEQIITAAVTSTVYWDTVQLSDFMLGFAEEGNSRARSALYESFDRQSFGDSWPGGPEIIKLDGIEGMLHIAEVVGARMRDDDTYSEHDSMLHIACERYGEEEVLRALKDRAEKSAEVGTYMERIEQHKQESDARWSNRVESTLETTLAAIEAETPAKGRLLTFAEKADPEVIEILFEKMLTEQRTPQLLRYLWLFERRAVPRLDQKLFNMATSEDKKIRRAALEVLSIIQHPDVRAFAIQILKDEDSTILRRAIEVIANDYESDEITLIMAALDKLSEASEIHDVGFALLKLAKQHQHPELKHALLWMYENTPCSYCRLHTVELLIERNEASHDLLEECRWDSMEETRELAEKTLNPEQ